MAEEQQTPIDGAARILLAEDNQINQHVAVRQLERLGYAVDIVENGAQAIGEATSGRYALVLMDCQMPEMDGSEATKAIRKIERWSGDHVPIVAMTANALSEDRGTCLSAGMDDYISKPVSLDVLRRIIAQWLRPIHQLIQQAPSVINVTRLRELFGDDQAGAEALMEMAVPSLAQVCERIRMSEDPEQRRSLAHELKGAAANVGADELSAAALLLESHLKSPAPEDETDALIHDVDTACARLARELRRHTEGMARTP